jgi:hypothetical protein
MRKRSRHELIRTAVGLGGFGAWAAMQLFSGNAMDRRYGQNFQRWFGTEIAAFDMAFCLALVREAANRDEQASTARQMRDVCWLLALAHLLHSRHADGRRLHLVSGALVALYGCWWRLGNQGEGTRAHRDRHAEHRPGQAVGLRR